ncbi:MAG: hypothetical protein LBH53_03360 [Puniceicoccales bacterium]|jgi:hypothetical protein|nr:hypothetical protein [Puniceicoccales bacterium]
MRWPWTFIFLCSVLTVPVHADERSASPFPKTAQFSFSWPTSNGEKNWDATGNYSEPALQNRLPQLQNLYIRIFDRSAGEIPLLVVESPVAQYDNTNNQFAGADFIHVRGNLFTAVGGQWTFSGDERCLVLDGAVQVFLEIDGDTSLENALAEGGRTAIGCQHLQIIASDYFLTLHFSRDVSLRSSELSLDSDELVLEIAREEPMRILDQEFAGEAIRSLRAAGAVHVEWPTRSAMADGAQIFPGEGVIFLSGNVSVLEEKGQIQCQELLFRSDRYHVAAEKGTGRWQDLQFSSAN